MADILLFGADHPRVLLNIGGMANLTFVPRRRAWRPAASRSTPGPGMAIIDAVARLVSPGLPVRSRRRRGRRAARWTERRSRAGCWPIPTSPWLRPKSTGRERFGAGYARALADDVPGPDGVRTAVELTAASIADQIRRWTPDGSRSSRRAAGATIRCSGSRWRARLGEDGRDLRRFDDLFFPGDAKEAVAFALLGVSRRPRTAGQRSRRDRRRRPARAGNGHAGMTVGRLLMPSLRWRDGRRLPPRSCHDRRRAQSWAPAASCCSAEPSTMSAPSPPALREQAGRPLLIGSDLERGAGQQVRGLGELPPPRALAALGERSVIRGAGLLTASGGALGRASTGCFAPDADLDIEPQNPIVQTRSFGADPERVAEAVRSWIAGCEAGGALACAKHLPGHGRTRPIPTTRCRSWTTSRHAAGHRPRPFAAAIAAGVGSIMTCHVAFPALDPSGAPATLSSPILHRLREDLSFHGLIVTDALIMAGARGEDALVRALGAGCDLLLYPDDTAAAVHMVEAAIASGRLVESHVAASVMRAERAASHWSAAPAVAPTGRYRDPAALADALLERPLLRGHPPRLRGGLELVVVDDDTGGAWPASPSDYLAHALGAAGAPLSALGERVVLAFAEPRASKGRAGFSAEHRRRLADLVPDASLVVLFGHPRLLAEIPGEAPVLLAWHRQRLMQEAVARWLVARLG